MSDRFDTWPTRSPWAARNEGWQAYAAYKTPPGYWDLPFVYVFNANALTGAGANHLNMAMALDGDSEFHLRRVTGLVNMFGVPASTNYYQFRDAFGRNWFSNRVRNVLTTLGGDQISVVPELVYPRAGAITFDIYGFTPLAVASIPFAYLIFQGIKRFPGNGPVIQTYPFTRVPQTYVLNIDCNTLPRSVASVGVSNFLRFTIPVNDYDFEWYRLMSVDTTAVPGTGGFEPLQALFRFYDCFQNPLSNALVPGAYICDSQTYNTSFAASPGIFPVPGLIYPAGSVINIDIASPRVAPTVETMQLVLDGAWRIPCRQ